MKYIGYDLVRTLLWAEEHVIQMRMPARKIMVPIGAILYLRASHDNVLLLFMTILTFDDEN
jgi:hypothetical protein